MSWEDIYRDMAFSPFKAEHVHRRACRMPLLRSTASCKAGRSNTRHATLAYLEKEFGLAVVLACKSFRSALLWEDETAREQVCLEAISMIERALLITARPMP